MKKTLSLLLAALLCLGMLAGCASEPTTPSTPADDTTVADTPATTPEAPAEEPNEELADEPVEEPTDAPADEPVEEPALSVYPLCTDGSLTLTMMCLLDQASAKYYNNLSEGTNLAWAGVMEATGVNLEMDCILQEQYSTQFGLTIAAESMPDIMQGSQYNGGLDQAYEDEVFIRLNEYEDLMPNFMSYVNSNDVNRKACYTDAGNLMGFGGVFTIREPASVQYYIRQDWLDALQLEVPTTLDEWYNVLTAFKANYTGDKGCLEVPTTGTSFTTYFIGAFDCIAGFGASDPWLLVDGQMVYSAATDGWREYIELMKKWYSERLINQDFMSTGNEIIPNNERMADNLIGAAPMTFNMGGPFWAQTHVAPEGAYYTMCPIPMRDENTPVKVTNYSETPTIDASGWHITTSCEIPEVAIRFLDYFYSPEGSFLTNYGIEGVTFNYDENGKPVQTDLIRNNPDGLTMIDAQNVYLIHQGFVMDTERNFANLVPGTEGYKIWEYGTTIGEYNFGGKLSFTPEETSEIARISTDVTTYVQEMLVKWITGVEELDDKAWDTYIQNLENMDYLDMVEMRQAAYERYLAK